MARTTKGIVLKVICWSAVVGGLLATGTSVRAQSDLLEPDLLVYPNKAAEFRYNPAEFELITSQHPDFNSDYSVGGVSLWDKSSGRVAYEVFRAPNLTAISPSTNGRNEFVVMTNEFKVIVDGFGDYPRYLGKVYLRFVPDPPQSTALIEIEGELIDFLIQEINPLDVRSQNPEGFYTNTERVQIRWSGAVGIRITAYGDRNNNRVFDGGNPRWSIYVADNSVPVENTSWGAIKAMYGSD
jgi:hypothetical protein